MQLQTFFLFLILEPFLAFASYKPPSNDASETFFLYFRQGTQKIPVTVQMDVPEKFAYVSSMDETGEDEDSISLYDYRTHVIAFKDVQRNICYLEDMKDSSLLYERRLLQSLRNQVLLGSRETLYAEDPSMTRRQIQSLAGKRVARFCASAVTYRVTSHPQEPTNSGRSKRSATSNVPSTRDRGFQRSYSHHEQHTQSYANFGHETISFDGSGDALTTNSHPDNAFAQKEEDGSSLPTNSSNVPHITTASSHSGTRLIRELPRNWPPVSRFPTHLGAGGNSGQIHSHMRAGDIGNHGFTATGQFQTANTHVGGNSGLGHQTSFNGAQSDNIDYEDTEAPTGFSSSPANNFPYGTSSYPHEGTSYHNQQGSTHTDQRGSLPGSSLTGGGYAQTEYPTDGRNGNGKLISNGYPPYGASGTNGGRVPSTGINGQGANGITNGGNVPSIGINGQGDNGRTNGGRVPSIGVNGPPQRIKQSGNGFPGNGAVFHSNGAVQNSGFAGRNGVGVLHPSSVSTPNKHGESGLSSQSQIELENGKVQTDSSTQGTYGGGSVQSQVQGSASKDGMFQAQAQSGFHQGRSQSQVQGSESGAQASSSSMLTDFGQTQSQTQMSYDTRTSQASSQTISGRGIISAQSQGGRQGGQASSQAQGNGATSSAANVGINNAGSDHPNGRSSQDFPFTGTARASSRGGINDGRSQTEVKGDHQTGSSYSATAEGAYGLPETNGWPTATASPMSNGNRFTNGQGQTGIGEPLPGGHLPSQSTNGFPSSTHQGGTLTGGDVMAGYPSKHPSKHYSIPHGTYSPAGKSIYPSNTYPGVPLSTGQTSEQPGHPSIGHSRPSQTHFNGGQQLGVHPFPPLQQTPSGQFPGTGHQPTTHHSALGQNLGQKSVFGVQNGAHVPSSYSIDDNQSSQNHRISGMGNGQPHPQQPDQSPPSVPLPLPQNFHPFSPSTENTGYHSGFSAMPQSSTDNGHAYPLSHSSKPFSNGNVGVPLHIPNGQSFTNNGASGNRNGRNGAHLPLYSGQGGIGGTPLYAQSRPATDSGTIASKVMAGQDGQLLSTAVVGGVEAGQAQSQGILHGNGFRTHVISRPGGPIDTPLQPSGSHTRPWVASGQAQAQGYNYRSQNNGGNRNGNVRVPVYPNGSFQRPSHEIPARTDGHSSGVRDFNGYPQSVPINPQTYPVEKGRWPISSQPRGIPLTSQRQPHYLAPMGTSRKALYTRNRYAPSQPSNTQCKYMPCSNGYRLVKSVKICKLVRSCRKQTK